MSAVNIPYISTGKMQMTAVKMIAQNGLAPGNEAGPNVATRTRNGSDPYDMFSAMLEPSEISRTSPVACRVYRPDETSGVVVSWLMSGVLVLELGARRSLGARCAPSPQRRSS